MKNLYYSQLSLDAQIEAFRQVMALNPIETRTRNMSDLLENYEYNRFGEVMQDKLERYNDEYEGLDPEYYSEMLD